MEVLPKRFEKFGLKLHPEKTRLIPFRRPARDADGKGGPNGPGTFIFLGFTHYWGKSLKGTWVVKHKTASTRVRRAIAVVWAWCKKHRHDPPAEQHQTLRRKLQGHYAYFGRRGNYPSLSRVYRGVLRAWRKWLSRRSWASAWNWNDWNKWLERWALPPPKIVHSKRR